MKDEDGFVLKGIREALARVDRRIRPQQVMPDASLVDELGVDSIRFVDLALALEAQFGIEEFPIQEWVDDENRASGKRFTVASLIGACKTRLGTTARAANDAEAEDQSKQVADRERGI